MSAVKKQTPAMLLVTRNLPPLTGGMERLNLHLALALREGYRVAVAGPTGCSSFLPFDKKSVCEANHRSLFRFLCGCAVASLRLMRKVRPDVVMAGSGLTAPLVWFVSRLIGAKTAVYLHGIDVIVDNRIYQWLWLPMIRRMDLVLANSRHTGILAERAGVHPARIQVLNPGTEIHATESEAGVEFRKSEGLGDVPLLLAVGRLTKRKGLVEFVERVLPSVLQSLPDTVLLIIGEDATDALHSDRQSQLARIKNAAATVGVESAIRFLPHCEQSRLCAAYCAADLHVFPVLETPGDVEGFGMVAVEAAAHGLPTIAFNVGGVGDAVLPGKTGELIPSGDYDEFTNAVLHRLKDRPGMAAVRTSCTEAARHFGWDRFEDRLRMLLEELAGDGAERR